MILNLSRMTGAVIQFWEISGWATQTVWSLACQSASPLPCWVPNMTVTAVRIIWLFAIVRLWSFGDFVIGEAMWWKCLLAQQVLNWFESKLGLHQRNGWVWIRWFDIIRIAPFGRKMAATGNGLDSRKRCEELGKKHKVRFRKVTLHLLDISTKKNKWFSNCNIVLKVLKDCTLWWRSVINPSKLIFHSVIQLKQFTASLLSEFLLLIL